MKEILALVPILLGLLKPTEGRRERKNLRIVKKTYKAIRKEYKKDGFTEIELETLAGLKAEIIQRTLDLGKK